MYLHNERLDLSTKGRTRKVSTLEVTLFENTINSDPALKPPEDLEV